MTNQIRKLNSEELRRLQFIELKILLEFDRICQKYGLGYFLTFGTALGAVRHHGFIPWDDDIDVGMLRPDYDKFCSIVEKELGEEYFWQSCETDKNYFFFFGKIRLNHTCYKDKDFSHVKGHHGIYIDVFPFEGAPTESVSCFLHRKTSETLRGLMAKKWGKPMSVRSPLITIAAYFWRNIIKYGIPSSWINACWKWNAYRYDPTVCSQYVVLSFGYEKVKGPKEWFFPVEYLEFEGHRFPCPKQWHAYLTRLYDDYMEIPPPEKRLWHPVVEFDPGPFENLTTTQVLNGHGIKECTHD